jgi:hypothetical protein
MTDRPILFSGPMVRAILEGRKTQTRRPLKMPPTVPFSTICRDAAGMFTGDEWGNELERLRVPHAIGDRLWVRETWALYQTINFVVYCNGGAFSEVSDGKAGYRADGLDSIAEFKDNIRLMSGLDFEGVEVDGDRWRPSIHMPRWASRLTLIVTDVRVQRLQDISPEDAIAEGPSPLGVPNNTSEYLHIASFANLWDACYGPGSWDANPWVVATTFSAHHCNIDQMVDKP